MIDDIKDSSETLVMNIMNRLHKLETLSLNFNKTKASTLIVQMLIIAACRRLACLKSLDLSLEGCLIEQNDLKPLFPPNFEKNLQDLKLNFNGCKGLNLKSLMMLHDDIITFCPELQRLFISTLDCPRYSNGFDADLEEKYLENLDLKWFRFEYSRDLDNTWDEYQKMEFFEMKEKMILENYLFEQDKVDIKEKERIQKEVDDFLDSAEEIPLCDERRRYYEQAYLSYCPLEFDLEDLERDTENEEDLENRMEEEIRLRDLTQGGQVTQISLDYGGDSYRL